MLHDASYASSLAHELKAPRPDVLYESQDKCYSPAFSALPTNRRTPRAARTSSGRSSNLMCRTRVTFERFRLFLDREEAEVIRVKHINSGDWRTVESFWNAQGTAFFRLPAGARIKVRYGVGFLGFNRQEQVLDGSSFKKLEVGFGSVAVARMQIRVSQSTDVTYDVYPGGVAVSTPKIPF